MIHFEFDLKIPAPYVIVRIDGNPHVLMNPTRYNRLPSWLRLHIFNDVVARALDPRHVDNTTMTKAQVIDLCAARELRTGT